MTQKLSLLLALSCLIAVGTASLVQADGEILAFAVVREAPKDKARISAKVSMNDAVSDLKLLASETILNNLIWKKLEICHAMKIQGYKVALWTICLTEGFSFSVVEDISDNYLIVDALKKKTKPAITSPTAYFFYNFAYHTFNPKKSFILH